MAKRRLKKREKGIGKEGRERRERREGIQRNATRPISIATKAQPLSATLRMPSSFHCGTLRQLTSLRRIVNYANISAKS